MKFSEVLALLESGKLSKVPDMHCYEYEKPSVTVDVVLYSSVNDSVLFVKRVKNPYQNHWALPGGFLEIDETTQRGAIRELFEETGVKLTCSGQLVGVLDEVNRDIRDRVISLVYVFRIDYIPEITLNNDECLEHTWIEVEDLAQRTVDNIAFDHIDAMRWRDL